MTNDKLGLVPAPDNAIPSQIISLEKRMTPDALDDAIRAQLVHVAIGVGGTGRHAARILIDLSVFLSLANYPRQLQARSKHGYVLVPFETQPNISTSHDAHVWEQTHWVTPKWSSVCTQMSMYRGVESEPARSAFSEQLSLRLLFDAIDERVAGHAAELLCMQFSKWHAATTSLRVAMSAIREALLEPWHLQSVASVPLVYRSASVCKGWQERILDPTSFLQASQADCSWSEPKVPNELSEIFARRCEAVWSETAKSLPTAELFDEETPANSADLGTSDDAADDFVCSDRMLSLWYGSRRRRRRRI